MASAVIETSSPGLYDMAPGVFTEDPTSSGLYFFDTPYLVEDPTSPGLYLIFGDTTVLVNADPAIIGNRAASWRIDLLNNDESPAGSLDGVDGGSLEWSTAQIKGRGTLNVTETFDPETGLSTAPDWLNIRIRPVYVLNDTTEWPRSIFIPTAPVEQWSDGVRSWSVDMLDKSCVLAQDRVDAYYSLAAGVNVIDSVRDLIVSSGENAGAITDSTETLAVARAWPAGTSKLTIINELLDSAGYFALIVDMTSGQFRVEPSTRPAQRSIAYELTDGSGSIYGEDFTREVDIYGIPNKVIHVSQGTSDTEALTSIATNTDPSSPYSYAARGRWIVNDDAAQAVDATSQEALDIITRRDLINATSVTATIDITHAPLPNVDINAAVRFANTPAGVDARHVITRTTLTIESVGALALASTTLRQVVDL